MAELDVTELMNVAEAIGIIDSVDIRPRIQNVPLEQAYGLTLAEEIAADRDYPPFDKSLMDGFAICSTNKNLEFDVVGEVAAGQWPSKGVARGEALAIMTGAPLPSGADCVVPVEWVKKTPGRIQVVKLPDPGQFIARHGHDAKAGQILLNRGQQLAAAQIGVAATVGKISLKIFDRPRVGIFTTGNEIVPPDQPPARGQIRNCNSMMLTNLVRRLNCQPVDLGSAPDKPEIIAKNISEAMARVDVLLITGGMSVGDYDYVPAVLQELGVVLRITKLRIKPGKPFLFGMKKTDHSAESGFVFGLPGNPVSAFVCTARLVSRLLRRLQGQSPEENWIDGALTVDLPSNGPREFYQPARYEMGRVTPLQWRGSADIFTLARAQVLLARPENAPAIPAGQTVRVMALAAF